MDIWKVLGIEKTKSQEEIVEAYRAQLEHNNPEENQEGFMALRDAYEKALQYAKSEDDEFAVLFEEASNIYGSLSKRINLENWKKILQDPLFQGLDTRIDGETKLIHFLMDNYRLPSAVFSLIADEFHWDKRREELNQHFSAGFFNYVFDVIENGEYYKMEYFDGDDYADYDAFIEKCMDFAGMVNENSEQASSLMEELDAMEIYHPYYYETKAEYFIRRNETEQAEEITRDFPMLYPDNLRLLELRLRILTRMRRLDEGREIAEKIKSMNAQSRAALLFEIVEKGEEDVEKAKDAYYDFNREYNYDDDAGEIAKLLNERLVPKLEERGEAMSEMDKITLAWAYYERDEIERAYDLLCGFEPSEKDVPLKYYKLKGYLSVQLERFEKAIDEISRWEELREDAENEKKDDNLSEEAKERNKINEFVAIYRSKSYAYSMLGQDEKAEEYIKKVIEVDDRNLDAYITLSNMYLDAGRFEDVVTMNTEAMNRNGEIGPLLYLTGLAEFRCENYSDAIRLLDLSLEYMPYLTRIYHYRLMIFDGWNLVNDFENVLEDLKQSQNEPLSPKLMELYEIKLIRLKGDNSEARARISGLLEKVDEADEMINDDDRALIYQEASNIYREMKAYERGLEYIEKALEYNKYNRSIELDKGYLLVLMGRYVEADKFYTELIQRHPAYSVYYIRLAATKSRSGDKEGAIQYYKQALEIDPERYDVYSYISDVYLDSGDIEKATEYKTLAIEKEPSYENYYDRAHHYYQLGKVDETYQDLLKAQELHPYESDVLTFLARCNMKKGEYDIAEENYQKAIEYFDEHRYALNTYMYYTVKLVRERRYQELIPLLQKAFTIFGEDGGTWPMLRLAEAYFNTGDYAQADGCYHKAIRIDDSYPEVHYEYAVFLLKTRGEDAAKKYLLGLDRSLLQQVDMQRNIGLFFYMYLLDFERAEFHYQKAMDLSKEKNSLAFINFYEAMWYNLRLSNGKISDDLLVQRKFFVKKKIQKMENYFKMITDDVEDYYREHGHYSEEQSQHWLSLIAEAYFYLGDLAKAEFFANKCMEAMPEDFALLHNTSDALYILGMVCEARGQYEQALEYYERISHTRYDFTLFNIAIDRVKRKMQ